MFDEGEIEELCNEFLSLDGNMFLESAEDIDKLDTDVVSCNMNSKTLPNVKNNNFIFDTSGVDLVDKPDASIQMDLINKNFISVNTFERCKNTENTTNVSDFGRSDLDLLLDKKENEIDNEYKEVDEKLTSPDTPVGKNYFHRNGWASDTLGLWRSGPSSLNLEQPCNNYAMHQDLTSSVTYNSNEPQSLNTFLSSSKRIYSHQQLGAKVEMVYSLLSMLDMNNREDMSKTFLAMSSSPESCHAMRQSGCLPLLIQLIHSSELNREVRERAAEALHNIVHSQTDEKRRKREVRVLKLLQQVREFCDELKNDHSQELQQMQEPEKHPINAIGTLMKFSFDAEHRQAICILGGLHAISELIQVDYEAHGNTSGENLCVTLRRYAGMSLTNLTFGDCKNKALLCSFNKFMCALVNQLKSPCEDLRQVTASVLRNLSWRADSESKQALRDVGAVTALTISAMEGKKESTLKSILSALWNLSAHCSLNKVDICSVPGALAFLVKMLKYKSSSNTLAIVENAGGILRNISSHIAVREDYRQILRDNNCFEVLLEQLKSPSLTVVSNACGTLWNLSARCSEDQRRLWEMGATSMLRSLVQSKHKMISMGSSAALKNLLAANPNENLLTHLDSTAKSLGLQNLPTLFVRKKRALEQELNITLAETCDNIDSVESPTHCNDKTDVKKGNCPRRSESRDSVQSTQSDSTYERLNQISHKNDEKLLESKNVTLHESLDEKSMPRKLEEQKLIKRYKSSMIPTPTFKKVNQDRINEKTREEYAQGNNGNETAVKTNFKADAHSDLKETHKNGIPTLSTEGNIKIRNTAFPEEECLVKYNDNEFVQPEDVENVEEKLYKTNPVLYSQSSESPDSNCERNARMKSNSSNQCGFMKNEKGCERSDKNKEKHENLRISKNCTSGTYLPRNINVERFRCLSEKGAADIPEEFHEKVNEDTSESPEYNSLVSDNESYNSSEHQPCSTDCVKNNENVTHKHSAFEKSERVLTTFGEQTSQRERPKSSEDPRRQNVGREMLPTFSGQSLKEADSEEPQQSSSSVQSEDTDRQHEKVGHSVPDSTPAEVSTYRSTADSTRRTNPTEVRELRKATDTNLRFDSAKKSPEPSAFGGPDELETRSVGNVDGSHLKLLNSVVLPKFKVGSPMTDTKVLQMEANKICREIKKHQDFEMGCSLTSEVSLVSCSSFIDTGDCSLFDSSTDPVDFDEPENYDFYKVSSKFKNLPLRKLTGNSQTAESVSLPSLGSLKNEQIEALDLDSSILSVASITSEVAETYSKDFDSFHTYTKTYKVEAQNEPVDDTVADVTLVSNGDDTLNADSLQNNAELFDEDHSLHCQENLPLDTEDFEQSASDRLRKKLTPKEKRKTFHERYRTYTIRDVNGCKTAEAPSGISNQGGRVNLTKDELPEININNLQTVSGFIQNHSIPKIDGEVREGHGQFEFSPRTFCGESKPETFLFSKKLTEGHRDLIPDFATRSKTVNEVLNIGPAERKELVDNAKLVAFSLKTAVDDEPISDSEPEEPHVDFDTATYSKNYREQHPYIPNCSQELQGLEYDEVLADEEELDKKGARILKPNMKSEEIVEPPKGIRGRRKPLYSSPQKHSLRTNGSPVNLPKTSQIDARKSLPDTCTPSVLHREGTFTKEDGSSAGKKNEIKNPRTIPVLHRNAESKNVNSTRGKSGIPSGNPRREVSKIGRPLSTYTSRANERRLESDSSQRRSFSADAGNRGGGEGSAAGRRSTSTGLTSPKMRNSSSTQNVKAGSSPAGSSSAVKSKNPNLQNLKSQSDANLNLVANKDKGKQKAPKKEVTSKIASLWRKVEETKAKNKTATDNRVWISSEKNAGGGDEVLVVEHEEILDIPARKIVHSLTCQALSDEVPTDVTSQERNSRTVQEYGRFGDSVGKSDRTQRRNIISAVVSPYNYSPPVPENTTSMKIKQVDTFHKGSLKVTTV